jgi:Hemingway/CFA97
MIQYSEESLESRWYREHSIKIHKKRLQDIKERSVSIARSPVRYSSVKKKKLLKDQEEILKKNMMLYEKLTQISERKFSPTSMKIPKSLNFTVRKKEADRIIMDNLDIVKRLTELESYVSAKKLNNEYKVLKGYRQTISKSNLHERLKKITFKNSKPLLLPPINQNSPKIRSEPVSKLEPDFKPNSVLEKSTKNAVTYNLEPQSVNPNHEKDIKNEKDVQNLTDNIIKSPDPQPEQINPIKSIKESPSDPEISLKITPEEKEIPDKIKTPTKSISKNESEYSLDEIEGPENPITKKESEHSIEKV